MGLAFQAAILSAFTFPGVGHLYLKQTARGIILIIITLLCLGYLGYIFVHFALPILEEVKKANTNFDLFNMLTFLQSVHAQSQPVVPKLMEYLKLPNSEELITHLLDQTKAIGVRLTVAALIFTWIFGITNSFKVGLLQSRADNRATEQIAQAQALPE